MGPFQASRDGKDGKGILDSRDRVSKGFKDWKAPKDSKDPSQH